MERRINKKIENYISDFKDNVKQKATELGITNEPSIIQLMQYMYDYERLALDKEDFLKRKRVKNVVHLADRCRAKRATNEQCTRRRKDDTTEFCGTHLKGTPHGVCDSHDELPSQGKKTEIWAEDIQGIIYYIDAAHNVYQMEDIMRGSSNPKIIAKYVKIGDTYLIPEFTSK
jgi:hypothetical protein